MSELEERYKKGEIDKLGAYAYQTFLSAHSQQSLFDIQIAEEQKTNEETKEKQRLKEQEKEQLKEQFLRNKIEAIQHVENEFSEAERKQFREDFEESTNSPLHKALKRRAT